MFKQGLALGFLYVAHVPTLSAMRISARLEDPGLGFRHTGLAFRSCSTCQQVL